MVTFESTALAGLVLPSMSTTSAESSDMGYEIDSIDGEGVLELELPQFPLAAGEYVLGAGISDSETRQQYDHVRSAARLRVAGGVPQEAGGYLSLPGRWANSPTYSVGR